MPIQIHSLTRPRYSAALAWGYALSIVVVGIAAFLARATLNFRAALTDKPDIALYLLLPKDGIGQTQLLRQTDTRRDYLAQAKDGPELVTLKKGEKTWYVSSKEALHPQK